MSSGGQNYRSVGVVPSRLNEEGAATVRFRALEPGPASNLPQSATGQLSNAPPGVDPEVTIFGASFCGGSREETCEQFRQRFLNRLAYRPQATQAWIIEKLQEWPCVTRVCERGGNCCEDDEDECCPDNCKENLGNEFYVFMDGTFDCGIPPQCVIDEIDDWMFGPSPRKGKGVGQAPIGVCGRLVVPTAAPFNIFIDSHECLTPNQEQAIEEAINGFMLQVCPSTDILYQQLIVIIGQILGPLAQFDVHFRGAGGSINNGLYEIDNCGLRVACDAMPCVNELRFTSPTELGACVDA